jgi:hypothetical protein
MSGGGEMDENEYRRKHYELNRERLKKQRLEYYYANKERAFINMRRYQLKLAGIDPDGPFANLTPGTLKRLTDWQKEAIEEAWLKRGGEET